MLCQRIHQALEALSARSRYAQATPSQQRVEHLLAMAARRMGKQQLSRGFAGWAEMALEAVSRENECGQLREAHLHKVQDVVGNE